jgi:hypothetical protein
MPASREGFYYPKKEKGHNYLCPFSQLIKIDYANTLPHFINASSTSLNLIGFER